MIKVVQVRLREAGRIHFYKVGETLHLNQEDYCIVQSERGQEYGQIVSAVEHVLEDEFEQPLKMVLRKITINDQYQINKNSRDAEEARESCLKKIESHKLPMKLVDVEYAFDRTKIIFYFIADGRVDFRDLVKDLATVFKTRIELRQIGVRDEAKMMGGVGCCGRTICCATFLSNFEPINIKMAKDQSLSLNPNKISGICGRLLCCLRYEHECYCDLAKNLHPIGTNVSTKLGKGQVVEQDVLAQKIIVQLEDLRRVKFSADEVKVLKNQNNNFRDS